MESLTRRRLFESGLALGLGAILPRRGLAATPTKSILTLWLEGGPSQLETWDPHPRARIGGSTRAIETRIPGVQIAHFFERMADRIHQLSMIRSLTSREGDHQRAAYAAKTGYRMDPTVLHPSLGALAVRLRPPVNLEIPAHVALVNANWPARGGYLGADYDAFRVAEPGAHVDNLEAPAGRDRQRRRLQHLKAVTAAFAERHPIQQTHHHQTMERALAIMSSEQLAAFELDDEPDATRAAYGDHRFGRGCLVARRLIERGVRSVEVTLRGFDSHVDNHSAHAALCPVLDQAFSALLDDLVERDLLERTVLVCMGEFGRTPKINRLDGRDHWPHGFSCVLGGGGIRAGQVIGATDPEGDDRPRDPVPMQDLAATVLTALGIDPTDELYTPAGRPMPLSRGRVVKGLL